MFKLFKPKVFAYVEEYRFNPEKDVSETRYVIEPGLLGKFALLGSFSTINYDDFSRGVEFLEILKRYGGLNFIDSKVPFPRRTEIRKGSMHMKRIPLRKDEQTVVEGKTGEYDLRNFKGRDLI
jgi:hypothetical protein